MTQRRLKAEDSLQSIGSESMTKYLTAQSDLKKLELEVQVLKQDKTHLLDQVHKMKDAEKLISSVWEEKLTRAETSYQNRIGILHDNLERAHDVKTKKIEEKMRALEVEKTRVDEVTTE